MTPTSVIAFLSDLLVSVRQLLQLRIRQMLNVDHFIVRLIDRFDDLIQLEMNGATIAILRVLN